MSFQTATQTTDLDRVDNIGAVTAEARAYRVRRPELAAEPLANLTDRAKFGDADAVPELVLRYEPQLRKAANRARIAPQSDRQQAALTGFVAAVMTFDTTKGADLYTYAHTRVVAEVRNTNREHSPRPAAERNQAYYWSAMDHCDGDPLKARRFCGLMRLSVAELEPLAEADDTLAREILNTRLDQYDAAVRRDDAPEWEEYAGRPGRGLDGPTFDAIHQRVTYLDAPLSGGEFTDAGHDAEEGHDTTGDPNATDPYEAATENLALAQMLATLDDRDRDIMTRHLDGETDRAIADALGVSRPRVVNLRAAIVRRFRKLAEG